MKPRKAPQGDYRVSGDPRRRSWPTIGRSKTQIRPTRGRGRGWIRKFEPAALPPNEWETAPPMFYQPNQVTLSVDLDKLNTLLHALGVRIEVTKEGGNA